MDNRKRSEATEQERVINWARRNEYRCKDLKMLFHIPNGGSRNKIEAAHLKAQGVKAGVPDLFLAVPVREYSGLFVEMKYGRNKTTEKQEWWLEELKKQGYMTTICYGAEEAIQTIAEYLGIPAVIVPAGV